MVWAPGLMSSSVGIRSEWRCAACRMIERMHQVLTVREPALNLPPGWRVFDGRTYCPEHIPCFLIAPGD